MVNLFIQFNGKQLTIPINPKELTISRDGDNEDLDIVGIGKAVRKGPPSLRTLTIDSFFPAPGSHFYTGVAPSSCVGFIDEIWNTENTNNNVARIVTAGLPVNLNMYFVITSFNYDHKAGEEDDIYYKLEIKEYRPYGVKVVDTKSAGLSSSRASSTNKSSSSSRTYTVKKGDNLWNITKKYTGSGSRWSELYNLNKNIIDTRSNNPDLIYPGQVLTLPAGW